MISSAGSTGRGRGRTNSGNANPMNNTADQSSLRGVASDRNRGRIKSASDVPLSRTAAAAAAAAASASASIPSSPTKTRSILPDTNLLAQLLTGKNSAAAASNSGVMLANEHSGTVSRLPIIIPVQTIDQSASGQGMRLSEKTMTLLPAGFTPDYVKLPEGQQRLLKNEPSLVLQPVVSPKHNADEAGSSATGAINKGPSSMKAGTERVHSKVTTSVMCRAISILIERIFNEKHSLQFVTVHRNTAVCRTSTPNRNGAVISRTVSICCSRCCRHRDRRAATGRQEAVAAAAEEADLLHRHRSLAMANRAK